MVVAGVSGNRAEMSASTDENELNAVLNTANNMTGIMIFQFIALNGLAIATASL
jgi:hypothetical protein